jgi:phosphopantothenoylcysteine decarboxylase/phosphopantothenate--cysteine ligase
VVLVSGPTALAAPLNVQSIKVQTSAEMAQAVKDHYPDSDVVIKAAAVSDYRPEAVAEQKIKKHQQHQQLRLVKTADILMTLGQSKGDRLLVGFAAETESIETNALEKLRAKNLDMIVANRIGPDDSGFQASTNEVTLFFRNRTMEKLPVMPKIDVAHVLLDRIAALLSER